MKGNALITYMLHNGNLVINEWIYIQPGRYLLHNNDNNNDINCNISKNCSINHYTTSTTTILYTVWSQNNSY